MKQNLIPLLIGESLLSFLWSRQVIKGWDEGITLLNIGSKATLIIPPSLGYGSRAMVLFLQILF